MAASSGPDIIDDGLILCTDAKNTKSYPGSGTAWTNLAGSTDLTLDGATFDSTYPAINFDGSNDKLTCSTMTCGDIWTQQCFYRPTDQASGGYGYFNQGWSAISEGGNNGALKKLYLFLGGVRVVSTSQFETGIWYNIAWVYNTTDNEVKVYVNGVLDKTTAGAIDKNTFSGIGSYSGTTHSLNGKLANFMIYNRELTATEILQNYNALKHRFV